MLDLSKLKTSNRLLLTVPLKPMQGDRFQPTGFPSLGAANYQTKDGQKLLVEIAQSMANRLETTCWDTANNAPVTALAGISHVTVTRKGRFLTDSMLEAHRISPLPCQSAVSIHSAGTDCGRWRTFSRLCISSGIGFKHNRSCKTFTVTL